MVNDDFSALDFLSMGGFRLSPEAPRLTKKKKRFVMNRPTKRREARRPLSALLPLISRKWAKPALQQGLQGWPISLSWPTVEAKATVWPYSLDETPFS